MKCPDCGGKGFVFGLPLGVNAFLLRMPQLERSLQRKPCPNPDCHAGRKPTPDEIRERGRAMLERIRKGTWGGLKRID